MNEAAEAMRVSYWRLQIASEIVVLPPELTSLLPTESLTFETGRALVDLIALRGVNAIRQAAAAAKNVVPRLSPQRLLARLVGIDRAPFTVKVRRGTKPNGRPGGLFVEMHLDPSDADSENRLEMVANLLNMKFAIDSAGQSETFVAKRRADRKPQVAKQQRVDVPCPIERLSVSADMDGSTGSNRNRLHGPAYAENDAAALLRWLSKYENPATRERYRSETERLLLWATFGKGKPLSSLNVDDANEYINRFVVAPKPSSVWVTKGRRPRDEPAWRPFSGPLLSDRSRQKSLYVLKKCFKDLVSYGYLIADPFERISVEPPSNFRGEK